MTSTRKIYDANWNIENWGKRECEGFFFSENKTVLLCLNLLGLPHPKEAVEKNGQIDLSLSLISLPPSTPVPLDVPR